MKRFILIVNNKGYSPADGRKIIENLRGLGYRVVDVRIAKNHIEIDLLSEFPSFVEGFELLETVEIGEKTMVNHEDDFRKAIDLFNRERFWEAHETLEPIWRSSKGVEKQVLHGLILTAAAFVHLQKNDRHGFQSILKRALKDLSAGMKVYRGIDLDDLVHKVNEAMKTEETFTIATVEKP
ncbi:MAG: DUF309 domain-containing protein [Candidatus Caldarchaeum sp.]|nr:DUF309 domain-containing protein [Candidatus Caldarchaeum sp.]MCX8202076.1 DUF309 domain-containing protein [Candidatus Caldarchaeum sp.]MDW8063957.1 DUF309 domain-containing protein [Candidatus Caldarchaeum sp.]MDW8436118.1 DUF309 domain-containing protein [Candidatus Caldarchaeum sp.]